MEPVYHVTWNPLEFCQPIDLGEENLAVAEIQAIARDVVKLAKQENIPLNNHNDSPIYGREVGDDRVDLSRSGEKVVCTQVVQQSIVKMVTSPEDTGIRRGSWNFCEVSSAIPTDPHTGYDFARKTGDFTHLGYNDSIILRIVLDVSKGEEHHSSTPPGKMSMLGSRLATPRRENRAIWQVASLFQDAMLCTHKASEPKYLPQAMGGTGVTALFDNPDNVFLYVRAYKGGTYERIYGTATNELAVCLEYLHRGIQTTPILSQRLREKQEYFWGTYDQYVFVPRRKDLMSGPIGIPVPLYRATGGANLYQNFENRLIRTRDVVTRSVAEREWATTQRQESIISGFYSSVNEAMKREADLRTIAKHKYGNALNANSALQNLLRREATMADARAMMGDAAFLTLTEGKRHFERSDAYWIYRNGQGELFSLDDIHLSEDIYLREEVSVEETFKVGGIPLQPITNRGIQWRPTKTRVGLWQINNTMEQWAEKLTAAIKEERDLKGSPLTAVEVGPIFDRDPEWVNDDSGIVARAMRDYTLTSGRVSSCILVSDDRRLASRIANTVNIRVRRVAARDYVSHSLMSGGDVKNYPSAKLVANAMGISERNLPAQIYFDTGSITAAAAAVEMEVQTERRATAYRRELRATGWDGYSRTSDIRLIQVSPLHRLRGETHHPVERPRLWRQGSRPSGSVYSSHSSWRNSNSDSSDWRNQGGPASSPLTT
jgi:hypothetical protein